MEEVSADGTVEVDVLDEHGPGGAHHVYRITLRDLDSALPILTQSIIFQRGGILEAGVNGVSCEALLAIVSHRLQHFQAGVFPCPENQVAFDAVNEALQAL